MVQPTMPEASAPEHGRIKEQEVRVAVVADRNNNTIGVRLMDGESKTFDWDLLNYMGQLVASARSIVLSPGWNQLEMHTASIASGVYVLSLISEGTIVRSTIILGN